MNAKPTGLHALSRKVTVWWTTRAPRERRVLALAAWVVGLSAAWWLAIAPAMSTLRTSNGHHARLDAQIARLQQLAGETEQVRALNASPATGRSAAVRALEQSLPQLGEQARLNLQGSQASVTLQGTSAEALALWLNQMRVNARLFPVQVQLRQAAEPGRWVGQVVLSGPGLQDGGL